MKGFLTIVYVLVASAVLLCGCSSPTTSPDFTISLTTSVTATQQQTTSSTPASTTSALSNNESVTTTTPTTGATGKLTDNIFQIMQGDTYHVKMMMSIDDETVEMEIYAKGNMSAVLMGGIFGMDMRVIVKDNKSYTIFDELKMIVEDDIISSDEIDFIDNTSDLTFVGEGSGFFNGKTCKFDEYVDSDGGRYFYYVDGNTFVGVRSIINGETSDVIITAFDKNVPDSVFNIPSDYEPLDPSVLLETLFGGFDWGDFDFDFDL